MQINSVFISRQSESYTISVGIDNIPEYVKESDGFLFRRDNEFIRLSFYKKKNELGRFSLKLPPKTPDDLTYSGLFRVELQPQERSNAVAFIAMDEQYRVV